MGGAPSNSCETQSRCADFTMTQLPFQAGSPQQWEICMGLNAESKGRLFQHECSAITSGWLTLPMAIGCVACEDGSDSSKKFRSSRNGDNRVCDIVSAGEYAYFGFGSSHDCIASGCDDFTLEGTVFTDSYPDGIAIDYADVTCGRGLDSDQCGADQHVCSTTLSRYFRAPWFDFSHCLWGVAAPPSAESIAQYIRGPPSDGPPGLVANVVSRTDLTPEEIAALTGSINDNLAGNSALAQAMVDALQSDWMLFPKGNNGGGGGGDPAETNDEIKAPILGSGDTYNDDDANATSPAATYDVRIVIALAFMIGLVAGGVVIGAVLFCKYNRKLKGMMVVASIEEEGDDEDVYTATPTGTELQRIA